MKSRPFFQASERGHAFSLTLEQVKDYDLQGIDHLISPEKRLRVAMTRQ
jgi:hypothetical protein